MINNFDPPGWLANQHLQTILSSSGPRGWWLDWHCRSLVANEQEMVLETDSGGRLLCFYNQANSDKNKAVVLIHGWEGSSHSAYILSAAKLLLQNGFSVYRLNMRDHGPSHHLNEELFRSTRLDEVAQAISLLETKLPGQEFFIAGFSLGGNFVVRIAASEEKPRHYLAVCPVIQPGKTLQILEQQQPVYHRYFVRKWKRSLAKKLLHFPDIKARQALMASNSLADMHVVFVEHHSEENTPAEYFSRYQIDQQMLENIHSPCTLLSSRDDPIIPAEDFEALSNVGPVKIDLQQHGGHCGFIDRLFAASWIDRYLLHWVDSGGPQQ